MALRWNEHFVEAPWPQQLFVYLMFSDLRLRFVETECFGRFESLDEVLIYKWLLLAHLGTLAPHAVGSIKEFSPAVVCHKRVTTQRSRAEVRV